VSECDLETSIMGRLWPTRGCCAIGKIDTILTNAVTMMTNGMYFIKCEIDISFINIK
jgi:hypothetical protein